MLKEKFIMNKFLKRIIFSGIIIAAWYFTLLLSFISFEYIPGYGNMETDCASGNDAVGSYVFQDVMHFFFIGFGAFLTAIVLVIKPEWVFNI